MGGAKSMLVVVPGRERSNIKPDGNGLGRKKHQLDGSQPWVVLKKDACIQERNNIKPDGNQLGRKILCLHRLLSSLDRYSNRQ